MVRFPDGSRALTDLYFPQFNLHLEIDEKFHEGQKEEDLIRELDIIQVTEYSITRIKITDQNKKERSLNEICSEPSLLERNNKHKKNLSLINVALKEQLARQAKRKALAHVLTLAGKKFVIITLPRLVRTFPCKAIAISNNSHNIIVYISYH